MKKSKNEKADEILGIYRFFHQESDLYLEDDEERLDMLFDAIVDAINEAGVFKTLLPYTEFVLPCKRVREGDAGWVGHFEDRDNRRFFLSDIYDYLKLFYGS